MTREQKTWHDFSEEEADEMTEAQAKKVAKCGDHLCFTCNGDVLV